MMAGGNVPPTDMPVAPTGDAMGATPQMAQPIVEGYIRRGTNRTKENLIDTFADRMQKLAGL